MFNTAVVLFIVAAVFGLILVTAVFKNKPRPSLTILAHGVFAGFGLLILIAAIAASQHISTLLLTSLGLFVVAALGGLTMLSFEIRKKPIPKSFAIFHPLLAASALLLLVMYIVT